MPNNTKRHEFCHEDSRKICKKIHSELLGQYEKSIKREPNENGCGYRVEGYTRFAELFHRASPAVRIEFRADPDPAKRPPSSTRVMVYNNKNSSTKKYFPYYMDINVNSGCGDIDLSAKDAASILIKYAIPLAQSKKA